jgi:hypothetical protein
MEKKGELLNQLAIVSDLLEKLNTNIESKTIILNLKEEEFLNSFNIIQKKYGRLIEKPNETFTIKIGEVDIIFNMSNV